METLKERNTEDKGKQMIQLKDVQNFRKNEEKMRLKQTLKRQWLKISKYNK